MECEMTREVPEMLKQFLREHPGNGLIVPDGSTILALGEIDDDYVFIFRASPGENFLTMSPEVLNHMICVTLEAL